MASFSSRARMFAGVAARYAVLAATGISLLAGQALATYRFPSDLTLMPSQPTTPGKVEPQTVRLNDTDWAYFVYVPPTYDSTSSKVWPMIFALATAECCYYAGWGQNEDIVMTTHLLNGGPAEELQTPASFPFIANRFIVVEAYPDGNVVGPTSGKPQLMYSFFNYAKTHFKVDTTKISFKGSCWGAAVLWDFATLYPKYPSCMVLLDGNEPGASPYDLTKTCTLSKIPIRLYADNPGSEKDSINIQPCQASFQACGTTKETLIYTHTGMHENWDIVDTTSTLYDWMLSNSIATSVISKSDDNQEVRSASAGMTGNALIEVVGLNGQTLLRYQGDVSQVNKVLSNAGHGACLIRATQGVRRVTWTVSAGR